MIRWLKRLFTTDTAASVEDPSSLVARTDTEFSAEVVRITAIQVHPNADKLELARFEMKGLGETAYEVVIQKGTAKVGDLMGYFSVDCVLPTAHPEFAFLAKEGRTHHRLRAARLRGVYSQGLLVKVPADNRWYPYGEQIAEHYGVTYHRDPEPSGLGPTAPSAKLKVQPCPVYGVDSLKKMPRLFDEGESIFITEKIHGTNFRFGWVRRKLFGIPFGWKFVVGSHRVMKGTRKTGHFYGSDIWLQAAETMGLSEKTAGYKGLIFYAELFGYTYDGAKIQDMTYGRQPDRGPGLAVFDIRDLVNNDWYDAWDRLDVCFETGLPHVPVLNSCTFYRPGIADLYAERQSSTLHAGTIREGVVIESLSGSRKKAKFVSQAYLLRKDAS